MKHMAGATGVQSIERTIAIVRAVAQFHREGARLVDISRSLGITTPTAHRILQALVRAGWVEQDQQRRRFYLGVEIHALGLVAAPADELIDVGRRAVSRLAEQVGDTVYFQVRAGYDSVCLARCEGSYPVKILTVDVGMRQPLGMGAGNVAILAALPDAELDEVVKANLRELKTYAAKGAVLDEVWFRDAVSLTRRCGHSLVQDTFIPGMAAVGMPIIARGAPVGALSVAAITDRLQEGRRAKVVAALQKEVRAIEVLLSRAGSRFARAVPPVPVQHHRRGSVSSQADAGEGKQRHSQSTLTYRDSRKATKQPAS